MIRNRRSLIAATLATLLVYALVITGCAAPDRSDQGQTPESGSMGSTASTTPEQTQTTMPETSTTVPTETTPSPETTSTEQPGTGGTTRPTYNMKQRVTVDGFQLIVMSRSFAKAVGGTKAPSGKRLLRLTVWVKNTSGAARQISANDFKLMDAEDNPISAMRMRGSGYLSGMAKKTLRSNRQRQYKVVFAVPQAQKQFTMTFTPGTGTSEPVEIIVK